MARNKVLERAKVSAPVGRNEFDLSCLRYFTAYAGNLNLAFAQPVLAGTHGRINRNVFTRTADVVAPAFPMVTQHLDFFIVPIKSLWSYWENMKLNINDLKSTQLVPFDSLAGEPWLNVPDALPSFDFGVEVSGESNALVRVNACERVFPDISDPSTSDLESISTKRNNMIRLCESAGYGRVVDDPTSQPTSTTHNVLNLAKLAAYQKCYFEHYRNTAYESNNPYAYNLDWVSNKATTHIGGIIDPTDSEGLYTLQQLFTLRKVNYRNDYFHNIYPALNYVLSTPSGHFSVPSDIQQLIATSDISTFPSTPRYGSNGAVITGASVKAGSGTTSGVQGLSVQSIRLAFALDKLSRASAYAPKHVKEQWKAQFGVDIPEDSDMVSKRLGSFQNDVIFHEVTNMSQNSDGNLGDLGAKGIGNGNTGADIEFYATYDSIIIGLHYFMPRAVYDAFGINIWNTYRYRGDFYSRFFENLGLRPLYQKELDSVAYYRNTNIDPNTVIGFSVPNQVLKLGMDLNLDEFKERFVTYDLDDSSDEVIKETRSSYLRCFTMHNSTVLKRINGGSAMSAGYFKVYPQDLNYVFRTAVISSHPIGDFQFYGQLYIKMFISASMAVHGQPRL